MEVGWGREKLAYAADLMKISVCCVRKLYLLKIRATQCSGSVIRAFGFSFASISNSDAVQILLVGISSYRDLQTLIKFSWSLRPTLCLAYFLDPDTTCNAFSVKMLQAWVAHVGASLDVSALDLPSEDRKGPQTARNTLEILMS